MKKTGTNIEFKEYTWWREKSIKTSDSRDRDRGRERESEYSGVTLEKLN